MNSKVKVNKDKADSKTNHVLTMIFVLIGFVVSTLAGYLLAFFFPIKEEAKPEKQAANPSANKTLSIKKILQETSTDSLRLLATESKAALRDRQLGSVIPKKEWPSKSEIDGMVEIMSANPHPDILAKYPFSSAAKPKVNDDKIFDEIQMCEIVPTRIKERFRKESRTKMGRTVLDIVYELRDLDNLYKYTCVRNINGMPSWIEYGSSTEAPVDQSIIISLYRDCLHKRSNRL